MFSKENTIKWMVGLNLYSDRENDIIMRESSFVIMSAFNDWSI